jgi:hypothetical protein
MADKWAKVGKSKARSSPVKKTTKPDQQNVNLAAVAEFAGLSDMIYVRELHSIADWRRL